MNCCAALLVAERLSKCSLFFPEHLEQRVPRIFFRFPIRFISRSDRPGASVHIEERSDNRPVLKISISLEGVCGPSCKTISVYTLPLAAGKYLSGDYVRRRVRGCTSVSSNIASLQLKYPLMHIYESRKLPGTTQPCASAFPLQGVIKSIAQLNDA